MVSHTPALGITLWNLMASNLKVFQIKYKFPIHFFFHDVSFFSFHVSFFSFHVSFFSWSALPGLPVGRHKLWRPTGSPGRAPQVVAPYGKWKKWHMKWKKWHIMKKKVDWKPIFNLEDLKSSFTACVLSCYWFTDLLF